VSLLLTVLPKNFANVNEPLVPEILNIIDVAKLSCYCNGNKASFTYDISTRKQGQIDKKATKSS
jgi:hypothetical protein